MSRKKDKDLFNNSIGKKNMIKGNKIKENNIRQYSVNYQEDDQKRSCFALNFFFLPKFFPE